MNRKIPKNSKVTRIPSKGKYLSPGTRVLVDGKYPAVVVESFLEGSHTHLFPHYCIRLLDEKFNIPERVVSSTDVVSVARVSPV